MKIVIRLLVLAVALFLVGCSSLPRAPIEQDAAAKSFTTDEGKANLYIYRNEQFGGAVEMDVLVNNKPLGKTGPKTYFALSVPPGQYTVMSKAENDSTLTVDVAGGKNYFVWQEVKMGVWYARSLLQLVDDDKGKAGVLECARLPAFSKF